MIRYVTENDESQILSMMELVKDDFAGYKESEFLEAMYQAISNDEAIMEEENGNLAGLLMCSKKEKELTVFDYSCQRLALRLKSAVMKMARKYGIHL